MKSFVRILLPSKTILNKTVEQLANQYNNISELKQIIRKIGVGILDNESLITGKNILLKPNWVNHNLTENDDICLRTNDNFLIATIELLIEKKPQKIVIGDAPIQSCNWGKLFSQNFLNTISNLGKDYNIQIELMDFRRVTFDSHLNNPKTELKPINNYVIFDLKENSYLESISKNDNIFRVTNYDPKRLAEFHRQGVHKYCITKELFDTDLIINMPKVKTHQKTGITCALKNLVGLNGDKDYLPHHRKGGVGFGGDCYPGKNYLRLWSENALDKANRKQGKKSFHFWVFVAKILWKCSFPKKEHDLAAAWYGNDTTWRMVMDLNRIAIFGKKDGTLSKEPQRDIYSLCDGIVGGQGNGPIRPDPLPLGVISFSNNSPMTDICMGTLMGFDIHQIPLLEAAYQNILDKEVDIFLNSERITFTQLSPFSVPTTPPPGWINYLK
jgi:uncharacterized protein (DUF362 family)